MAGLINFESSTVMKGHIHVCFIINSLHTNCHLRGDLIEDPDLSALDSRSKTSGMTTTNTSLIKFIHLHYQLAPSLRLQTLESSKPDTVVFHWLKY